MRAQSLRICRLELYRSKIPQYRVSLKTWLCWSWHIFWTLSAWLYHSCARGVRRSQFEIVLDVLELIQDGEYKPTRLMRDARISWTQFRDIIAILVEKKYVTVMDQVSGKRRIDKRTKRVYSITPKGVNVVRYYRKIDKLLDETTRQLI